MCNHARWFWLIALITVACWMMLSPTVPAVEPPPGSPKLGLHFTELPASIKELRFAFECKDGLQIEARWIAQNVGDAAPANSLIAKVKMVTRGPLNLARLSRPTNGWPLGLYRLELWHNQKPFHTVRYVIEQLDAREE